VRVQRLNSHEFSYETDQLPLNSHEFSYEIKQLP
jgi:hypothetical protein